MYSISCYEKLLMQKSKIESLNQFIKSGTLIVYRTNLKQRPQNSTQHIQHVHIYSKKIK